MGVRVIRAAVRLLGVCVAAVAAPLAASAQARIDLTLDEAVQYALDRNLDIRVERLSPQAVDLTLASIRALYHPTLNTTVGQRSQVNLPTTRSYPLFGSAADAEHARARLERRQRLEHIKALELQVATEVTTAALQVQSAIRQIDAATAARSVAERRLDAEQSKFEVGLSTNFFVVQAHRDLQDARNRELRALIDHQKALVDFERVQETSLQRSGISIVTDGGAP